MIKRTGKMKKVVQAKKEKNQRGEDQDRSVEDKTTRQDASAEKSKCQTIQLTTHCTVK